MVLWIQEAVGLCSKQYVGLVHDGDAQSGILAHCPSPCAKAKARTGQRLCCPLGG